MSIDDQIQELSEELPPGYYVVPVIALNDISVECQAANLSEPFLTIQGDDFIQMIRDGVQACIEHQKNN
tara:strand:+ start:13040 stop:13246 length:207 start_codon:yes stop_codon:yes gene_type:complete